VIKENEKNSQGSPRKNSRPRAVVGLVLVFRDSVFGVLELHLLRKRAKRNKKNKSNKLKENRGGWVLFGSILHIHVVYVGVDIGFFVGSFGRVVLVFWNLELSSPRSTQNRD
jgi:hypothetical protein